MHNIELTLPSGKKRFIGPNEPIFIAAEIGVTCNYEIHRAKTLIDVASEAGADAVKLAFHFPDELLSDHSVTYKYPTVRGEEEENMYEMFNYLRFSYDEWEELKAYADSKDLLMFCSLAGGFEGIEYAEKLELPMHKLGAWDLLDERQWKRLKGSGKPLIIDVGTITEEEMGWMMDKIKGLDVVLLHEYHSHNYNEMNIRSIKYIRDKFNVLTGFSSPDTYDVNDFMSIAQGAVVLEKRVTTDRSSQGHHHIISKEPEEFKKYVQLVRQAEVSLGEYKIQPTKKDLEERGRFFKRIVASKPIKKGEMFTEDNLACRRPSTEGISSRYYFSVVGRIADKDYEINQPITE
jgi:N,N'-diacetyllegionaminate synthase